MIQPRSHIVENRKTTVSSSRRPGRRGFPFSYNLAAAALTLAVLSYTAPQVLVLGHGYRTTLPALGLAAFFIFINSPGAFINAFIRFRLVLIFGFLFLLQAGLRFSHEETLAGQSWHTFFFGPLGALMMLWWIGACAELGKEAIQRLRLWSLISWCFCLAVGIPMLLKNPGVARTIMGNVKAGVDVAKLAFYGVGEYGVYTSLAICFAPMAAVVFRQQKTVLRWIAGGLLMAAALAVFLSTFTMASVLMVGGMFSAWMLWSMAKRKFTKVVPILLLLAVLVFSPGIYLMLKTIPQTQFITSKMERLVAGVSEKGLEKGDETGRGQRSMEDLKGFLEAPILGYIPGVQGYRDHGHSSLTNSLTNFGLAGTLLWGLVLWSVYRSSQFPAGPAVERRAMQAGWLLLLASGILNPTWHSAPVLISLFLFTVSERPTTRPRSVVPRRTRHQ